MRRETRPDRLPASQPAGRPDLQGRPIRHIYRNKASLLIGYQLLNLTARRTATERIEYNKKPIVRREEPTGTEYNGHNNIILLFIFYVTFSARFSSKVRIVRRGAARRLCSASTIRCVHLSVVHASSLLVSTMQSTQGTNGFIALKASNQFLHLQQSIIPNCIIFHINSPTIVQRYQNSLDPNSRI